MLVCLLLVYKHQKTSQTDKTDMIYVTSLIHSPHLTEKNKLNSQLTTISFEKMMTRVTKTEILIGTQHVFELVCHIISSLESPGEKNKMMVHCCC